MESQPQKRDPADAKRHALHRLLRQIMADISAGKTFDEAALIAAHPELMPELQIELGRIRAAKNSRTSKVVNETMLPPTTGASFSSSQSVPQSTDPAAVGIPGYTLQRELGRGGQAVVYLAIQQSTGRKVAVKLIHKDALADDRALARFKREVQVLAALDHPNIVGIIDTGAASDGSQFIVMSYVAGSSLDEYMKVAQASAASSVSGSSVSPDRGKLLRLFLKICDAVNVAHLRGIVHRDLKPANIRIDERGEPHVLDFGLAHTALDHLAGADHPKSIDGEFLGSLPWSSPEQAQADPQRIDIRSDVYSLGVILYQIITNGKFPYEVVGNIRDVLNNILSVPPTPPSKLAPPDPNPINPTIERIVMKALAKNREERYQSAGELGRDVARYLAGQRMSGRQSPLEPPPPKSKSPVKGIALAAGATVILCAIAFGIGFYLHKTHQAQASSTPLAPPIPIAVASATSQPTTQPAAKSIFVDHINAGTVHLTANTLALIPGPRGQCTLYFGSRTWSDYDLTFQFMTNGLHGFWIQPHTRAGEFNQLVIDAFEDNIGFVSVSAGVAHRLGQPRHLRLDPDRWYDARLQSRGADIQLFLDGQQAFDVRDENITRGTIGIGTRNPSNRFRDIKVLSPTGAILWDAQTRLPHLDPAELDPGAVEVPPAYRKINLLASVHPHVDTVQGLWLLRAGILSGQGPAAQLHFTYVPSGEYEYRLSLTRLLGIQPIAMIATQNGRQFAWIVGGHRDTLAGFAMIDGRDYDLNVSTRGSDKWLGNESKLTLVLRVAKDSVAAYVNGQQAGFYKTDFADMTLPATWYHPPTPTLGIWLGGDHVAIDSADVLLYSTPFNTSPTTAPSRPAEQN